ncbi:MAG: shikimate kinase [Dokdonella sp.]
MNPAPNLFFIGPMGAGKTTVGRQIAELFQMPFFDLDHEIEARTGASVSLIFELEDEEGFRRRERALLAEFTARNHLVLATGGGAVLDPDNRRLLRERGFVIWLDASIDAQLARLTRDRQRPLLHAPDRRVRLEQLAIERNPLYAKIADLTVRSAGVGNCTHTANDLLDLLEARWQRGNTVAAA